MKSRDDPLLIKCTFFFRWSLPFLIISDTNRPLSLSSHYHLLVDKKTKHRGTKQKPVWNTEKIIKSNFFSTSKRGLAACEPKKTLGSLHSGDTAGIIIGGYCFSCKDLTRKKSPLSSLFSFFADLYPFLSPRVRLRPGLGVATLRTKQNGRSTPSTVFY